MSYTLTELMIELDLLMQEHRTETETFLVNYISESNRNQEITATILETPNQTFQIQRTITYGDITTTAMLIMLLVYTIARQLYSDLRGGL